MTFTFQALFISGIGREQWPNVKHDFDVFPVGVVGMCAWMEDVGGVKNVRRICYNLPVVSLATSRPPLYFSHPFKTILSPKNLRNSSYSGPQSFQSNVFFLNTKKVKIFSESFCSVLSYCYYYYFFFLLFP